MRIVQTLWTGDKPLLENTFGWRYPEYNLMSWAMSCLSLREHYDEVVLFTDSEGAHILADKLKLPYTDVIIAYDGFKCLPQHWALSKINTYYIQTGPFIHIDGDIFLPHKLSKKIEKGRLVAQNHEYGTSYYKHMMDRLLECKGICIPDFLEQGLREGTVSSYNMGFFGGTDLTFIYHYCEEVFRFFEANRLNDSTSNCSSINCNVIFEQVFFALLAGREHRKVETVLKRDMRDDGYAAKDFCNVMRFNKHRFFHLLGGHKLNRDTCYQLERTLLRRYPDTYRHILELFPGLHRRINPEKEEELCIDNISAPYTDFIRHEERQWRKLTTDSLFKQEQQTALYCDFLEATTRQRNETKLERNPQIAIYALPKNSKPLTNSIRKRLAAKGPAKCSDIAVIPSVLETGIREIPIDDAAYNILSLLDVPKRLADLRKDFRKTFSAPLRKQTTQINDCFQKTIGYLLRHGLITIRTTP